MIPNDQATAIRKPSLTEKVAHLAVGEYLVLPYAEARNTVTVARRLQDGRRWSVLQDESGDYQVWRRA